MTAERKRRLAGVPRGTHGRPAETRAGRATRGRHAGSLHAGPQGKRARRVTGTILAAQPWVWKQIRGVLTLPRGGRKAAAPARRDLKGHLQAALPAPSSKPVLQVSCSVAITLVSGPHCLRPAVLSDPYPVARPTGRPIRLGC